MQIRMISLTCLIASTTLVACAPDRAPNVSPVPTAAAGARLALATAPSPAVTVTEPQPTQSAQERYDAAEVEIARDRELLRDHKVYGMERVWSGYYQMKSTMWPASKQEKKFAHGLIKTIERNARVQIEAARELKKMDLELAPQDMLVLGEQTRAQLNER